MHIGVREESVVGGDVRTIGHPLMVEREGSRSTIIDLNEGDGASGKC